MTKNLNKEKDKKEQDFLKCKECSNKLTENFNKNKIEMISFKEKEYYAIKISDFRFFILAGKNKLFNFSKKSFLFDEVLCFICKRKIGIQVKSCREDLKYLLNSYFLIKTKKVNL